MRNYILWDKPEAPLINKEKYLWKDGAEYKLWDGYSWVKVSSNTGRIQKNVMPEDTVYTEGITALGEIPAIKASLPKVFHIYLNLMDPNLIPGVPVGGRYNPETGTLEGDIISELSDGTSTTTEDLPIGHWDTTKRWIENAFSWYSMATFTSGGSIIGTWSAPIPVVIGRDGADGTDGEDGRDGVDGTNLEFIFKLVKDDEAFQTLETPDSDEYTTDYIPDGWSDHPTGITREMQIEAQCFRKLNKNTDKWGPFYGPYKWSIWGETGKDGDGIEYIFRLTEKSEIDENDNLKREFWPPTTAAEVEAIGDAYQQEDYYPATKGWDDDPKQVNATKCYQFVSKRKYKGEVGVGGTWQPFSEPTLWDKYVLADVAGFTAFAFTRTNDNIENDTCTGGDASSPVPTQTITPPPESAIRRVTWHDTVPMTTAAQLWMVQRFFSDDPELESGWSKPVRWGDDVNLQIEYSNDYPWDRMPALPNLNGYITEDNEEGVDEAAWRAYCVGHGLGTWSDNLEEPKYMAVCYRKKGSWEDWTISQIAGENGVSYTAFSIYKSYDNGVDQPARPTGGHWDVENNVLTNVPTGWSLEQPDSSTWNYVSTARFESTEGNIVGRWSMPVLFSSPSLEIDSQVRYFKVFENATGVTAPAKTVDPTSANYLWAADLDGNGTIDVNPTSYVLTSEKPYLWSFDRITYSNGGVYQTPATIIRFLNDAISDEDIQRIAAEVTSDIDEELAAMKGRLDRITKLNAATTDITDFAGLYQILTSYQNAQGKSFADLLIDAEESKIKTFAGSEIDDTISSASSTVFGGLNAFVQDTVTKIGSNGTVYGAIREAKADAITDAVSKSYEVWKITWTEDGKSMYGYKQKTKTSHTSESWYPYIDPSAVTYTAQSDVWKIQYVVDGVQTNREKPKTKDSASQESWYPYIASSVTYDGTCDKMKEMSIMRQEADKVWLAVNDGAGGIAASISILGGATVQDGKIVLDAANIILNGNTIATTLNANVVNIGSGKIILDPNGLTAVNANILGNLFSSNGFFGTVKSGSTTIVDVAAIITDLARGRGNYQYTYTGVHINQDGIYSSNYQNDANGHHGFLLNGDSFEIFGANGTEISDSTVKITGEVTATSGYIGTAAAGFHIGESSIYNTMTSLSDTTHSTGIYMGTDGIALGGGAFKVTSAGALTAVGATLTTATVTGEINASSGNITGTLYLGSNGKLATATGWSNDGILINGTTLKAIYAGGSQTCEIKGDHVKLTATTGDWAQFSIDRIWKTNGGKDYDALWFNRTDSYKYLQRVVVSEGNPSEYSSDTIYFIV